MINNYVTITSFIQSHFLSRYMAPIIVHFKHITTTTTMTTITINSLSAYISNTSVVNSTFFFGTFQDTAVRSINLSILTIVPPIICAEPSRTAMITILYIRHIVSLLISLSVF